MTRNTQISRRGVLRGLGLGLSGAVLGGPAFLLSRALAASSTAKGLKFLFVYNLGGWDPLTVFVPAYGQSSIEMEVGSTRSVMGSIPFVDAASRPSVRRFLELWHARTLLLNGVNVPSLAHDVCMRLLFTGASSLERSDWATLLADATREQYTLPHLVLSGLAYPGSRGSAVSRVGVNGQLEGLLSGTLMDGSDMKTGGRPNLLEERILDSYVSRRLAAKADAAAASQGVMRGFEESHARAVGLKDRQYDMDFMPGYSLFAQLGPAVDALSLGIARCVTVQSSGVWDTHEDNSDQAGLFEGLFAGLLELMERLSTTPGEGDGSLADETVVVVLSEMGRTPRFNTSGGRDHWPYTSVMMVGPGLTGDRVVGGVDPYYYGLPVDPASGELYEGGELITAETLGATLLTLAGLDSEGYLPNIVPLSGVLV